MFKQKMPKPPKKITEQYLYNYSLYYLQRFTSSSGNLKNLLKKRIINSCAHHEDINIDQCFEILNITIEKLEKNNFLNDKLYTQISIRSFRNKGYSENKIKQKLTQKHINSELITNTLNDFDNETIKIIEEYNIDITPELLSAVNITKRKRIGAFKPDKKTLDRNKELATLARQGFSYDIATKALDINHEEANKIIYIKNYN